MYLPFAYSLPTMLWEHGRKRSMTISKYPANALALWLVMLSRPVGGNGQTHARTALRYLLPLGAGGILHALCSKFHTPRSGRPDESLSRLGNVSTWRGTGLRTCFIPLLPPIRDINGRLVLAIGSISARAGIDSRFPSTN